MQRAPFGDLMSWIQINQQVEDTLMDLGLITQICDEKIVSKVSDFFNSFLDADYWKNNEKIPSCTVSSQIEIYFLRIWYISDQKSIIYMSSINIFMDLK